MFGRKSSDSAPTHAGKGREALREMAGGYSESAIAPPKRRTDTRPSDCRGDYRPENAD